MTKASTLTEIIQVFEKPTFQKTPILYVLRNLAVSVAFYELKRKSNSEPDTERSSRTLSNGKTYKNVRFQRFEWMIFLPCSDVGGKK